MGRLQKKKTTTSKKAKQKVTPQVDVDPANESQVVKKAANKNFSSASKVTVNPNQEPGMIEKVQTFLKEVNVELKKVVWPAKNQAIASTGVVIVLVIIVSSFLGLFDVALKGVISWVLH